MDTSTAPQTSIDQMAEEIFSLTVMSWRERVASRQHAGGVELSESQFLTLDVLARSASLLTVGEVQRSIGVLPAQMSRIIRSLESFEKPLIRCELNQHDKRKIDVHLLPDGLRLFEEFRRARLSKTVEVLKNLSDADRREFVRICHLIRQQVKAPEQSEA